jgi:hypothetical protein
VKLTHPKTFQLPFPSKYPQLALKLRWHGCCEWTTAVPKSQLKAKPENKTKLDSKLSAGSTTAAIGHQ